MTQNDSCVCELQLVKQAISFYRVGVYTKESVGNKPKYYQNDVTMKPTSPIGQRLLRNRNWCILDEPRIQLKFCNWNKNLD